MAALNELIQKIENPELRAQIQAAVDSEEVVQLYASRPESAIERPAQELKAFQRVSLAPGESKQVALTIPRDDFRHWDEAIGIHQALTWLSCTRLNVHL